MKTQECRLGARNGKTWINGRILEKGNEILLQHFDRIVIGHTMLLFIAKTDVKDKVNSRNTRRSGELYMVLRINLFYYMFLYIYMALRIKLFYYIYVCVCIIKT